MLFDVKLIEAKAREASPKPYEVKHVPSMAAGKKLLGLLESDLTTSGFSFMDVEGDKNNKSCVASRKGRILSAGKHGPVVCLRLFERGDDTVSFFVHVQ